nr:MAG: DNA pilot protein [Microvirus sp.]
MGFFSGIGKALGGIVGAVTGSDLLDVASTGLSFLGGERANSANAAQSSSQMAFQRDMSNTAYQRAKADLEKAGYNPMLAAFNGGASTPQGAQATMQDTVTPALNSGRQASAVRSTINQQQVQNENIRSQTVTNATQAALNRDLAVKAKADSVKALADADLSRTSARSVGADADYKNAGKGFLGRVGLDFENKLPYQPNSARAVISKQPTIDDLRRVIHSR